MVDFELSLRQYQRMEQDPTAITSLWQVYKIAKAFNLTMGQLKYLVGGEIYEMSDCDYQAIQA